MEERHISIEGRVINYKIAGSGPAVLILHGWGRGSDGYIQVIETISGAGFQAIVPDLPGFGKTKPPQKIWGVQEYSDFVLRFMDQLGVQKCILFGHSFGGQVAVKVALTSPQRIERLILCAAAVLRKKPEEGIDPIRLITKIGKFFFTLWPLNVFSDVARKALYRILGNTDYLYSQGIMKYVREKVLIEDLYPLLRKVSVRTLIIWGDKDKATPVVEAEIIKERISNSSLEIIKGVGHVPYKEAPDRFFEILLPFLNSK